MKRSPGDLPPFGGGLAPADGPTSNESLRLISCPALKGRRPDERWVVTTSNVATMTVQLSMLGIVVGDMPTALRFYRLLGLDIPAEADEQPFVIHRMDSGVSLFFDTVFARTFDPDHRLPDGAGYSSLFEFYLGDDAGVNERYSELVAAGYHGRMAPAQTQGPYAAMVDDPDGHVILLTSDEAGLG